MYKCEILADSVSPQGNRLTTFKITYPRIIHAEMCRHRILSRNTASSRAVPFEKMVKDVQENPFIPIAWQKKHKGMQGTEYFTDNEMPNSMEPNWFVNRWLEARDQAVRKSTRLSDAGITKQLCNRLLEPFVWTTELVSGTEWENFFSLRCPQYYYEPENLYFKSRKDWNKKWLECFDKLPYSPEEELIFFLNINKSQAEIHIQKIAEMMWDCYNESTPKQLKPGEWHIPFGDRILITWKEGSNLESNTKEAIKIATARCARTSYMTFDGKIDYEKDIKLHDKLIGPPFHASPFEHCARAMSNEEYNTFIKGILSLSEIGTDIAYYEKDRDQKDNLGWCNNFKGFIQYRYLIENK